MLGIIIFPIGGLTFVFLNKSSFLMSGACFHVIIYIKHELFVLNVSLDYEISYFLNIEL